MSGGNLAYQFKTASIIVKLVVINGIIFLGTNLIAMLFQLDIGILTNWFVLPSDPGRFVLQPWSIITYSFLHADFFHVLFNMLYLFWFGRFILNLFSEKRFLTIYLLGAISGGALYLLGYNIFPAFLNERAFLLGASGAVMAIVVFVAAYSPQAEMRIFTFSIKIWHIALVLVLLDILRLSSNVNAGGMLAHLGGALFGYVYARQLLKGKDIGAWFERLMDGFANLFKTRKQKPFKKVHRNKATQSKSKRSKPKDDGKSDHQKQVDSILDKISKSGYESLTKAEKDFLFKAGKDN
ncbi:MAG: rhomboid family intramembrane serine protease [Flavobacteriaceae bacterium]|nr:rhomboid family intramembrane serine protease [Flavobacteriaceae bacterium]